MVKINSNTSQATAGYSRFVRRVRRRYSAELPFLNQGVPRADLIKDTIEALLAKGYLLGVALRITRQLVIERLAVLDIEQGLPVDEVTAIMTDLAEVCLDFALLEAQKKLEILYGEPCCENKSACAFWILGMGKLGGRELNVSSDIDLIYLYEEDGVTVGQAEQTPIEQISNHEYFNLLAKQLYTLIGKTTEHGFVFRMDLALRPNGHSGPMATSLPMLKTYFHIQGRDWERFAWMKARVVASSEKGSDKKELLVKPLIRSFVYRKYLDYNLLDSLRQTHLKVRQNANEKALDLPERVNDIKLFRGGIRELEFSAQLYQVVRGGQFPEIRTTSTLKALTKLSAAGLITQQRGEELSKAYRLLRMIEHRIQYLDDQQTHLLPSAPDDLKWIAQSLLHDDKEDALQQLREGLQKTRELVAQQFDEELFLDNKIAQENPCASGVCALPVALIGTEAFEMLLPVSMQERVHNWAESSRVQTLRERTKINLSHLVLRTGQWLDEGMIIELAALRFLDWLDVILRRESYHALLLERPLVHQRLLRLFEKTQNAVTYLRRYPGVVDELSSKKIYEERFDRSAYEQELLARREALKTVDEEDEESLLNLLRRAHHAEFFRTLARDVEGYLTVEQVADDLSALADITLKVTMQWSWDYLNQRHQNTPKMGIIAYGKLGGIELGYGSDLDIVFVYNDSHEQASDIYGAHVRKMIQWLTLKTAEGDLFEIDTTLRPNGNSGLLVTPIESFESYQLGHGSNTAWTWEHQALTRARCAVGDQELRKRFDRVRHQVITVQRDIPALKQEIVSMRARIKEANPLRENHIDVKHSSGGMLDIEFCVQFLVLAYAHQYTELEDDVGNIALLVRAEQAGLVFESIGEQAADSYRLLRQIQHKIRLNAEDTLPQEELEAACKAGARLWDEIFRP